MCTLIFFPVLVYVVQPEKITWVEFYYNKRGYMNHAKTEMRCFNKRSFKILKLMKVNTYDETKNNRKK